MKIRTQFKLFILGIIAVPVIFFASYLLNQYLRSPERMLMSGYKQVRKISESPLSERDVQSLRAALKTLPPEVELLIIANHSEILLSTINDFKGQLTIEDHTLFSFIKKTSNQYFYQIVSPPLEENSADVILIMRMLRGKEQRHKPAHRLWQTLVIFLAIFELFCIAFIIYLSTTISRSITILERNTERIAGGDLNEPLETPKDLQTSNEITNLASNLDKMRLTIKDDTERRTRFIMGISHDLRTPVAVIKGYTEAMSDGVMKGNEQKKALEIIGTKTEQLETMINTLINFVKLDSTHWREQLKNQKIEPAISEFAQACVTTGDIFKRTVTAAVSVSPQTEVPFDPQLFQRALENIFSNALRYTQDGDTITITANETDTSITIAIADTGIGIEKNDIEHIFDLFYRADNSRREGSMGIGLSVVKNIVDTHGWHIAVQSEKNRGTTFTIIIDKLTAAVPKND